jgi:hypothetical protein
MAEDAVHPFFLKSADENLRPLEGGGVVRTVRGGR